MSMDGFGISVDFDGRQLVVRPHKILTKSAFGSGLVVPVAEILSISMREAGAFRNGYLDLSVQGDRRYRLKFHRTQQAGFAELYQILLAAQIAPEVQIVSVGADAKPPVILRGSGHFSQEVVGESRYFRELRKMAGATETGERETTALLTLEPENKYDPNAVQVRLEGHVVGYIPREAAEMYQPPLRAIAQTGRIATCRARLWWSRERGDFIASVSLDLADPAVLLPVNPPDESFDHVVIPAGRTYQLNGEQEHMDVLLPLVRRGYVPGRALAYGTLHIVERVGPRTTSSIIAVHIDGHEIGELTKQTSTKLMALARAVQDTNTECYAEVLLTGNELAVEARLRVTPPEELSPKFIERLSDR